MQFYLGNSDYSNNLVYHIEFHNLSIVPSTGEHWLLFVYQRVCMEGPQMDPLPP